MGFLYYMMHIKQDKVKLTGMLTKLENLPIDIFKHSLQEEYTFLF